MKKTAYEIVTDRLLQALERGVLPWRRPWTGEEPANLCSMPPLRPRPCVGVLGEATRPPEGETMTRIDRWCTNAAAWVRPTSASTAPAH